MKASFGKRIYTLGSFLAGAGYLLFHAREVRRAFRDARVDKAFGERIMVAVTGVNDCRYCTSRRPGITWRPPTGKIPPGRS